MARAFANGEDAAQLKRRIRRSAFLYGGIALAFYIGFMIMAVLRGLR